MSEKDNRRHRVHNFVKDTLHPKNLLRRLDVVFGSLKCAGMPRVAFGFVLKNVEDGSCRYYYAHGNFTLGEMYKLKATTENLITGKKLLSNTSLNRVPETESTHNGNFTG